MSSEVKCPYCGSSNVEADFVDIGVGMMQCGPYCCFDCHAYQLSPEERQRDVTEEEYHVGWHKRDGAR